MTRPSHTHLLHTVALLLLLPATVSAVVPSQVDALLSWKASLGDPAALSSWNKATPFCSSWRGWVNP